MSTKAYITESHHKRSKMAESLRESSTQSAFALNTEIRCDAQAVKASTKSLFFRHANRSLGEGWWAHQDLNLGPADYESAALTN